MGERTGIAWTDATWNPVTGCSKVSPGCAHCYAERLAERFRGVKGHPYEHGFDVQLRPERLIQPMSWISPRRIFVCSMADLFHDDVPTDYICQVFETMLRCEEHTFQVLTKRPERMAAIVPHLRVPGGRKWMDGPPSHIWLGVSVENALWTRRLGVVCTIPAAVHFVSLEPLLGPVDIDPWLPKDMTAFLPSGACPRCGSEGFNDRECPICNETWAQAGATARHSNAMTLQWVIVGGESGPGARPLEAPWVRTLRDQCVEAQVPFFFKQWAGKTPKAGGNLLDGRAWEECPRC